MSNLMRVSNKKDDKLFKIIDVDLYNSVEWEKFKNAYLKNDNYKVKVEREKRT